MTDSEKIKMVATMTGETDEKVLATYLSLAGEKICRRAYPYDPDNSTVPQQYSLLHVEIAAYLLNKRGGEGEVRHDENGVGRVYENGDVPDSLMRQIIPVAAVVG